MEILPDIINLQECAALLRVDVHTIYNLTRKRAQNPLPCFSCGKSLRFFRADVLAWATAQREARAKVAR